MKKEEIQQAIDFVMKTHREILEQLFERGGGGWCANFEDTFYKSRQQAFDELKATVKPATAKDSDALYKEFRKNFAELKKTFTGK